MDAKPPIAFHREIAQTFGINGALYIQQLYHWRDRGHRKDGFIYKSKGEFQKETCLTAKQQDKIRKRLEREGLLDVKLLKANGAPTLHYKLNVPAVQKALREGAKNRDNRMCPNGIMELTQKVDTSMPKGKKPVTETTTEITTEKKKKYIKKNSLNQSAESCRGVSLGLPAAQGGGDVFGDQEVGTVETACCAGGFGTQVDAYNEVEAAESLKVSDALFDEIWKFRNKGDKAKSYEYWNSYSSEDKAEIREQYRAYIECINVGMGARSLERWLEPQEGFWRSRDWYRAVGGWVKDPEEKATYIQFADKRDMHKKLEGRRQEIIACWDDMHTAGNLEEFQLMQHNVGYVGKSPLTDDDLEAWFRVTNTDGCPGFVKQDVFMLHGMSAIDEMEKYPDLMPFLQQHKGNALKEFCQWMTQSDNRKSALNVYVEDVARSEEFDC